MTTETTHHNLKKGEDGEENWGDFLNTNFDDLDSILKLLSGDGKWRDFEDVSTPSDPGADIARVWAETDAGHTKIHYKDDSGIDYVVNRDNVYHVRNETGSQLNKGDVVYITGSNGTRATVAKADASDSTKMKAAYMLAEDISDKSRGEAFKAGKITGVDTSSFSEGDELWVSESTAGGLTTTQPSASNIRQHVGTVVKSAASGVIAIDIKFGFDPGQDYTWTGAQKFQTDVELDQQADDGSQRVVVRGQDGAEKAEIYFDGTDTIINPLSGDVKVPGSFATDEVDTKNVYATVGTAKKLLSIDPDEISTWDANNSGTWPDSANEFHVVQNANGGMRIEHENLGGNVEHILESGGGSQAWYGVQDEADHQWSWGIQPAEDDSWQLLPGEGLTGNPAAQAYQDERFELPRAQFGESWYFAESDAHLDDILNNHASEGDTIILGNATYSDARTISTNLNFLGSVGGSEGATTGTRLTGAWTATGRCTFHGLLIDDVDASGSLTFDEILCSAVNCQSGHVQINADRCHVIGCVVTDVTFAAGTSQGIAGHIVQPTTVTDNGDNEDRTTKAALTAADGSTVDATYGTQERDVIQNLVTRVNELEDRLQAAGEIV